MSEWGDIADCPETTPDRRVDLWAVRNGKGKRFTDRWFFRSWMPHIGSYEATHFMLTPEPPETK